MRRKPLTVGTAAMVGASLWAAPSAGAVEADACDPGTPPGQTVVSNEGHVVQISPGNAPGDATALASWASAYVTCLVSEVTNSSAIRCVQNYVRNRPTVSIDPETLVVTIDYHNFINTACEA